MPKAPKSDFLGVMIARGFMDDCTDLDGLDAAMVAGVVPTYIGYDATAPSLHVGHLLNIMMLRWLQRTGHQPITLMGGGTTKVGDPSFRAEVPYTLVTVDLEEGPRALGRWVGDTPALGQPVVGRFERRDEGVDLVFEKG